MSSVLSALRVLEEYMHEENNGGKKREDGNKERARSKEEGALLAACTGKCSSFHGAN